MRKLDVKVTVVRSSNEGIFVHFSLEKQQGKEFALDASHYLNKLGKTVTTT